MELGLLLLLDKLVPAPQYLSLVASIFDILMKLHANSTCNFPLWSDQKDLLFKSFWKKIPL